MKADDLTTFGKFDSLTYTLSEGNNIIDLTNFTAGIYMLRIENSVSKIVKK